MVNTEKRRRTAVPARKATSARPVPSGPPSAGVGLVEDEPSVVDRLRYRLDLALSRGPIVVVGYLGLLMLLIILVAAIVLMVTHLSGVNGGTRITNPPEAFWQALLRVLDSGTFAADSSWPARLLGLVETLTGIFLAGSLIGLIANAVDQQIERLRKGRSQVLERGHTLVLGWSPRLPTIIAELVEANGTVASAVVVLADVPKDEMEDDLRVKVPVRRRTRVVCRTGDPARPGDLEMVNIQRARSVIVLAGPHGDAGVVKAILAVRSLDPTFTCPVVAEFDNAGHAATVRSIMGERVVTVQADEVIARVTAQACHQSGLAAVFRDLLDFDGDEVYFTSVPDLWGTPYRDLLFAFESCSVMGWITAEGRVELNPPADAVLPEGAEVITVAEDDTTVVSTGRVDPPAIRVDLAVPFQEPAQRVLMVGWSELAPPVLSELDEFLTAGSSLDLVVDPALFPAGLQPPVPVLDHTSVQVLMEGGRPEGLRSLADRTYDQVIVLGYRGAVGEGEADARTMLTLLILGQVFGTGPGSPRVVAEVLDRGNVAVAQTTGVDDFIVSDELSSLMMAQLSERIELHRVFDELFDAEGAFVSLHPAALYGPDGELSFAEVVAAAIARGETALGWRIDATGEVVLNPAKSRTVELGPRDQVLILGPRCVLNAEVVGSTPGTEAEGAVV